MASVYATLPPSRVPVAAPRPHRVAVRLSVQLFGRKKWYVGKGLNLSATGVFVETASPLEMGAQVGLAIDLGATEHLFVQARIARVVARRGYGLEFVDLPHDARLALIAYIAARRHEREATAFIRALRKAASAPGPHTPIGRRSKSPPTELVRAPDSANEELQPPTQAVASLPRASLSASFGTPPTTRRTRPTVALLSWSLVLSLLSFVNRGETPAPATTSDSIAASSSASTNDDLLEARAGSELEVGPAVAEVVETRDAEIARLMTTGDALFRAGKWSLPAGSSALDSYRRVLALEPHNELAVGAVSLMCDGYANRAAEMRNRGDNHGARWRLNRLVELLENDVAGQTLPDRASRARDARRALAQLSR